jgi:hypothetical protein
LISGEVPAAVLTSAYPEAATWFPEIAGFKIFRIPLAPRSLQARLEPAGNAAAGSNTRTIQEQVAAATAVAERITVATAALEPKANDKDRSNHSETVLRGDAEKGASKSPNNTDLLVALLMARPEIKSVSDLTNKNVAIDDRQSAPNGIVRAAIVAAGAAEVQLSDGQTKAINRLISGEVPAAVLTSVSPEAAEGFPEIAGFKIFRIPLTPEMPPAKIVNPQPAGKGASAFDTVGAKIAALRSVAPVAADSHPETIQEQVAAATELAERMTAATEGPQDSEQIASSTGRSDRLETAPSDNSDPRVAILMARPEIKVVSDLSGKEIAIDGKQSASSGNIRAAIVAAGAAEVQVSEDQTQVINRLILAQVPAAVLTLVSPEAAEAFPEITGFRIFRVPLSPRSILVIKKR